MKLTNKIKLRNIIQNNSFLYAFLRLVQHRKDKDYLEMASLKNAPQIYKRENVNFKISRGCTYYIVEYPWRTNGFFAIMRKVLAGCAIADSMGWIPYVNVKDSIFNVPGGINGIDNMFEYYFKPLGDALYEDIIEKENYIRASYSHVLDFQKAFGYYDETKVYSEYVVDEEFLQYLGSIARKYVKLKGDIESSTQREIEEVIRNAGETVAVHFRGSDFLAGRHGHPTASKLEQYYVAVDEALIKGFKKIFLATDDQNCVDAFTEKYGEKVIYFTDVERTTSETGVHLQSHDRENDQYYLGLEVIRDMLALSFCDGIIAGLSQVSIYARIQKYANGKKYRFQHIIDNGINLNDTKKAKSYYDGLYKSEKVKS